MSEQLGHIDKPYLLMLKIQGRIIHIRKAFLKHCNAVGQYTQAHMYVYIFIREMEGHSHLG